MSVQNFIPTLWSARLLANLDKAHVYGAIVNRDYEGEIKKQGDSVKINQMGEITIGDYAKADIGSAEELTSAQKILTVDQAKYFNFQVDSVDQAQANIKLMDKAMERAGVAMADVVDKYIAQAYLEASSKIGDDVTPVVLTADNVYGKIVDLATALDEKNAPENGRFVVVPAFVHGLLLQAPEFVKGSALGDSVVTKGFIGEVAGFQVFKSNNVPNTAGAKYKIMAGHPSAITMAEQVVDVRAYEPEQRFSDAVKGLHVFGSKVALPDALAVLTANRG
jgi:hypothetical protein